MTFDQTVRFMIEVVEADDPHGFEKSVLYVHLYLAIVGGATQAATASLRLAESVRSQAPATTLAARLCAWLMDPSADGTGRSPGAGGRKARAAIGEGAPPATDTTSATESSSR